MSQDQKTILIIDDEEDICDLGRFCFEGGGFRVLTAGNMAEGARELETEHVDVVLTDVRMPHGDGVTIMKILADRPQKPLIYLMTGFSNFAAMDVARLGVKGILSKPFDWKATMVMIKQELGMAV